MAIVEFVPKARAVPYDGSNKDLIAKAVSEMFGASINDTMAGQDGALMIVMPGGATHVLLPGHCVVEFLGEVKLVPYDRMRIV